MSRVTAALAVLLLATLAPRESDAGPCRRGRFLFQRSALVEGGGADLGSLSLEPSRIAIDMGCRRTTPVLTSTRHGTRVSASWARCTGILDRTGRPARVKLKAFISAPACDSLTGSLVVRRGTPRLRAFTAARSRCGDGYLDAGNGEECGEEGAACSPGTVCTSDCTCGPPGSNTTTTLSTVTSTTVPGMFGCTEILGFSQTLQWLETPEFQQRIDDSRWQARLRAGGDIDVWSDPNADVWNNPPTNPTCTESEIGLVSFCSPCARGSDAPDRVLITITLQAYESNVQVWAQKIRAAIATIRLEHPQVHQIVLQPVVGGPGHQVCPWPGVPQGVRASYNHPYIDQAIAVVVHDSPDLVAGYSPEVQSCADYRDDLGHLEPAARGSIGMAIGEYYGP